MQFRDLLKQILVESKEQVKLAKKAMNTVFDKNALSPVTTYSTAVKGFTRSEGSGYRYEPGTYYVTFINADDDVLLDVYNDMLDAGIKVSWSSGGTSMDYGAVRMQGGFDQQQYEAWYKENEAAIKQGRKDKQAIAAINK